MPSVRKWRGPGAGFTRARASAGEAATSTGAGGSSSSRTSGADGPYRARASRPSAPRSRGQDDRAEEEGAPGRVVRGGLEPQAHGQARFDHVAVAPLALDRRVGTGPALDGLGLAVDAHREAVLRPRRVAQAQGEARRLLEAQDEPGPVLVGEASLLAKRQALLAPRQLRGEEEVDEERVALARVDRLAVAGRVLHPGPHAAPERVLGRRVAAPGPRLQRDVVRDHPRGGVLRSQDVVEEAALVEVDPGRVGVPEEEPARELQHVVGVAGLGGGLAEVAGEVRDRGEVLVLAVAPDRVGAVERDPLPERLGDRAVAGLSRDLAVEGGADGLRDLRVRVQAVERVLAAGEGVEDRPVVEEAGEPQVLRVPGRHVELRQDVLHPAELGLEHRLPLRGVRREARKPTQEAMPFTASSAAGSPVTRYTSRRPAMILWSV